MRVSAINGIEYASLVGGGRDLADGVYPGPGVMASHAAGDDDECDALADKHTDLFRQSAAGWRRL